MTFIKAGCHGNGSSKVGPRGSFSFQEVDNPGGSGKEAGVGRGSCQ